MINSRIVITILLLIVTSLTKAESEKVEVTNEFALPIVPAEVLKKHSNAQKIMNSERTKAIIDGTPKQADSESSSIQPIVIADKPTPKKVVSQAKNKVKTMKTVSAKTRERITKKSEPVDADPVEILIDGAETKMLPISLGHPNRIVTPFTTPKVKKMDKTLMVEVTDNVVYVATNQSHPVTIYIREDGNEAFAIPLGLFPGQVPPRQATLVLGEGMTKRVSMGSSKAKKWEEKESYQSTIKKLLTSIAKGQTPSGYSLRHIGPDDYLPYCKQHGLDFDFSQGQIIEGHHMSVVIGTLTNSHNQPIEFVEMNCLTKRVKAVAAWPEVFLDPGQSSEVYLVINRDTATPSIKKRPSLI